MSKITGREKTKRKRRELLPEREREKEKRGWERREKFSGGLLPLVS